MGKYNSRKKKLIALTIIVALQAQSVLPCCAAAVTPNNGANVPEEFGYAIPLLDGGMAYLIDKGKNAVKETLISK